MELTPVTSGHGCRVASAGPLLVIVFDKSAGPELLDVLETVQQQHADQHARFSTLTVVNQERLDAPTAEFRTRAAAMRAKYSGKTASSAMVILSRGVAAVFVRTFLAGYQLLVRHEYPEGSFRDVRSAVQWLQGLPNQLTEVKQLQGLTEAVETFIRSAQ